MLAPVVKHILIVAITAFATAALPGLLSAYVHARRRRAIEQRNRVVQRGRRRNCEPAASAPDAA